MGPDPRLRLGLGLELERFILGELATNCYILKSGDEAAVIDPGAEDERLLEALEGHRLKYILLTHAHPDHLGGAGWLKAEIAKMKRGRGIGGEARLLLHRGELEGLRLFSPGLEPDRFLEEGDSLPFGRGREGLSLKVLHTPGHSPGSLVFMVDRGLFVGDLVFSGSIGRTDLPGGSPREMERSLRRIIELEGDFRIFPGHGPETTLSRERVSNPFLRELQVRWPPERS